MNDEFRAKVSSAEGSHEFCKGITENVFYVRIADLAEEGLVLKPGTQVKFKIYTDNKGVGGCEVVSA